MFICLFAVVVVVFYSRRKERVERLRLFSVKALFFVRCITYVLCQGELTQLIESEGARYISLFYKPDRRCANKSFVDLIGGILCFLVVYTRWYILCKMDVC